MTSPADQMRERTEKLAKELAAETQRGRHRIAAWTRKIFEFAQSVEQATREETLKECAKVLCQDCRLTEFVEPAAVNEGKWRHKVKAEHGIGYFTCDAAAIHSLRREAGGMEVVNGK